MKGLTLKAAKERIGLGGNRQAGLAFFGKHPAFADFMPRIGSETETLVRTKQTILLGLEEQKRQWEELGPEKLVEGFDHWFVWLRRGRVLFGLLWSSRDSVGRQDAAGLCVEAEGVTAPFVLACVRPAVESLRASLQEAKDAAQVETACQAAREDLERLVKGAPPEPLPPDLEARKVFFDRPELGPDRQGWRRILHALRPVLKAGARRKDDTFAHIRVPLGTSSCSEALRLWTEFLQAAVAPGAPILAISRNNCLWLDLVVGEPTPQTFRCLQASAKVIPLATEIPYDVDPELPQQLSQIEARWLADKEASKRGRILLAAAVVLLGALAVLLVLTPGRTKTNPDGGGKTNLSVAPPAATAPRNPSNQNVREPSPPGLVPGMPAPTNTAASPPVRPKPDDANSNNPPKPLVAEVKLASNPEAEKALTAAREAEKGGNFTNALAFYWTAQKLNPADSGLLEHIKGLTPKAQEQTRQAEQQARRQQLVDGDFRKAMDAASAAASAGNYSNALAAYQGAAKIKDDPQARAGVVAMQQKIQEAINRTLKEQQAAKQFQEALDKAKEAEQAGDYAAALEGYKSAQTVRPEDPQVADKIKALTKQMDERKRADEARRQQQTAEAEQFDKAFAAGKGAEQAGSFTNALAAYQRAQKIRPADREVTARIQAITPKAEQQARLGAGKAKEWKLQTLDSELEVLMVNFDLLKPELAKTDRARKESAIKGLLTLEGLDSYQAKVDKLEKEYKTGGWLDQDQRAEKLKSLKRAIQIHY